MGDEVPQGSGDGYGKPLNSLPIVEAMRVRMLLSSTLLGVAQ